jgi:uncharacterized membrane protein YuzA (DUF378 family)
LNVLNEIFKFLLCRSSKADQRFFEEGLDALERILKNLNVMNVSAVRRENTLGGETMLRSLWLVAFVLVVVGAVNWGLVGLAQFDLVAALFGGSASVISRVVYSLVGIAGLLLVALQAAGMATPATPRSSSTMR